MRNDTVYDSGYDIGHRNHKCGAWDAKVKYKHRFEQPRPKTWYHHYSNEASQGSLICETPKFPSGYNDDVDVHSAYSDRIAGWDYDRFERACKIAGGGDQAWGQRLPDLNPETLKEFAKVALNLDKTPVHVRVVHYFNVSSGYSCPVVIAITNKE